jgi:hypothetical protein
LRAEGFSCVLEVLYEGLGISKLQFFIKKRFKKFSAVFFSILCHQNLGSGTRSGFTRYLILLNPDPDSINPDEEHLKGDLVTKYVGVCS